MLKLLRNFVLAGLLLAGVMKLLAWWAVGRDAERLVRTLAPYAQIKYDSLSAGLDGSVTLDKVSVGADHHEYRADTVVFESPGLFWLLAHSFLGGHSLPAQFSVSADGLKLPPGSGPDPQWFDTTTFVPFAASGCGTAFNNADYERMGVTVTPTHERLDYRYDADQHTLSLILDLKAPGFSQVNIGADFKKYDAEALAKWENVHIDQVSVDYTDLDFLAKRNQFCAQRVSSPNTAQFVERHIAAVLDLLRQKRTEPSGEVVQLYRTLVEHGGQASLLSLPSSGFAVAGLRSSPEDLLRQLNVTARYQDKPPIMFRLAFAPAPEEPPATPAAEPAVASTPAPTPASSTIPPATPVVSSATPTPTPTASSARVPPAAAPAVPATKPSSAAAASPPAAVVADTGKANTGPVAAAPAAPAPTKEPATAPVVAAAKPAAHDNLGLHNLDREEAKLGPLNPVPVAGPAKREIKSALAPAPPLLSSTEPPPSGSMQALVWNPSGFIPLPEPEPEDRNYDVIDYARLDSIIGRFVHVVTEGGKKIGGFVIGVDENGVRLRVDRPGGNVTFVVAKARVQQVQLPRQ